MAGRAHRQGHERLSQPTPEEGCPGAEGDGSEVEGELVHHASLDGPGHDLAAPITTTSWPPAAWAAW